MRLTPSRFIWVVLGFFGSAAAVYSFVHFGDPRYEASCNVADYLIVSVAAIGGVNGFVKFIILRHPVPTLRSFFRGERDP
jgi:hypothetical protein